MSKKRGLVAYVCFKWVSARFGLRSFEKRWISHTDRFRPIGRCALSALSLLAGKSQDGYRTPLDSERLVDVRYRLCHSRPANHKMHIAHRPIARSWAMYDICFVTLGQKITRLISHTDRFPRSWTMYYISTRPWLKDGRARPC